MNQPDTLLAVNDLRVDAGSRDHSLSLIRGVSFTMRRGQRLGVVGESGSGKSLLALSIMGLLTPGTRIGGGQVLLDGTDLLTMPESALARLRGRRIAMIYQDPMSALNPVQRIGSQIVEVLRLHTDLSKQAARARVRDLLAAVGVPDPARRMDSYPHEFSGGMRQRVMIAMALCMEPDLLIADEPTTALDVTTQQRIVELILRLTEETGTAVMFITHDLAVAAGFCDTVQVMYAGRIVERAPAKELFTDPLHPYTTALLDSVCTLDTDLEEPIRAIAGQPPSPASLPSGCSFEPRCRRAVVDCTLAPPLSQLTADLRTLECDRVDLVSRIREWDA